ncbi:hypothetical protein [Kitasatospora sp. NPDC051914]|uniref:hypothetical protein n=1 Tax=Kitasatospora sp. NPDC051914 TaxID=3154945 RepID=UPI0034428AC0
MPQTEGHAPMTSLDQPASDRSSGGAVPAGPTPAGDGPAEPGGDPTAVRLLAGLASRLRGAYEQGAGLAELAAACHRPEADVRRLLEEAGADLVAPRAPGEGHRVGGNRGDGGSAGAADRTEASRNVGAAGSGDGSRQLRRARRPVPSRRLRRLHPRPPERLEAWRASGAGRAGQAHDGADGEGGTPLGILIGGSAPAAAAGPREPERVTAKLVRLGAGTCLVVLPAWREAIAVAVPTERLLASTGLAADELAAACLTVLINPDALHDRDLALHGWQAEPPRQ